MPTGNRIEGDITGTGVITGGTLNQTINIFNSKGKKLITKGELEEQRRKDKNLIFKKVSKTSKEIYIERDIDTLLVNRIAQKNSKVLFLYGQGGIGKTTLLKKFAKTNRPTIFIDIQNEIEADIIDIFLDESKTISYNCPNFEKKLDEIFIEKENSEGKIPFNAEAKLLQAIYKDFEEHGVFIIDTFEKNKNLKVKSRAKFEENSITFRRSEFYQPFKSYLQELIYTFLPKTTFIIAGRNRIDNILEDKSQKYLDLEEVEEISLENFSTEKIKEYIKKYGLDSPNEKQLLDIAELTNGNPLLISLLVKVVKDYGGWKGLDYMEMKKIVQEDKDFGLLYYFTKRIASHIQIDDIWKLIIPRVLIADIENILFKENSLKEKIENFYKILTLTNQTKKISDKKINVFQQLVEVGLLYQGKGKEKHIYTLHDDVAMAIKSYAKKELSNPKISSWHDNKEVRKIHKKLMKFYKNSPKIFGANSEFESCYHKIMMSKGFEKEFKIPREKFIKLLLGSIFFSSKDKISICSLNQNYSINKYVEIIKGEKNIFKSFMTERLYNRFSRDLSFGIIDNIYNLSYLIKISKEKEFKNDWSIFNIIGEIYIEKKKYNKAIQAYQNVINITPKNNEAYFNMGVAYHRIKKYNKAIQAYQKSTELNAKNYNTYFTMGIVLYEIKEYNNAIKAFKKTIELNPQNDKVYFLIGTIYLMKKEYDSTIKAYQKAIELNPKEYKDLLKFLPLP